MICRELARSLPSAAPLPSDAPLWSILGTALELPALGAALELGVFDALEARPLSVETLATRTESTPRAVGILVRYLASRDLLTIEAGMVALTDVARVYLVSSSACCWAPLLERIASLPLGKRTLVEASRSGNALYGGTPIWDQLAADAESARTFGQGAHCRALFAARSVGHAGLLGDARTLLDVGGGQGTYAVEFARADPRLRITILDLPHTAAIAEPFIRKSGVAARILFHGADMFRTEWPAPMDAIWLSDIFHDWPAAACEVLAQKAFAALAPGGRIFLNEVLLHGSSAGPLSATRYELSMLFATQGRQYSFSELAGILATAAFANPRIVARVGVYSVLEAERLSGAGPGPARGTTISDSSAVTEPSTLPGNQTCEIGNAWSNVEGCSSALAGAVVCRGRALDDC